MAAFRGESGGWKIKERSSAVRGIVATPLATTLGPSLLSRSSSNLGMGL